MITFAIEHSSQNLTERNVPPPLIAVLSTVERALSPSFRSSWQHVLRICSQLFSVRYLFFTLLGSKSLFPQKLGKRAHPLMGSILLSIDRIYTSIDTGNDQSLPLPPSALQLAVQASLGAAITAMGVPNFLDILPLNLLSRYLEIANEYIVLNGYFISSKGSSKERAWLLPILHEHVSRASLGYFFSALVPLATHMKERCQAATQADLPMAAKKMHVVYHQLWGLFPRFAVAPIDLPQVRAAS